MSESGWGISNQRVPGKTEAALLVLAVPLPSVRADLWKSGLPQIANVSIGGLEIFSHFGQRKCTVTGGFAGSHLELLSSVGGAGKTATYFSEPLFLFIFLLPLWLGEKMKAICFQFRRT